MIDHILLDVIGAIRESFEGALLEQQAVEERFQVDVFLGDLSFETSYSLPGEDSPARVRADLTLDWPTWSQSAYRSWSIGEPPAEPPELERVLEVLERQSPAVGSERLDRAAPTLEQVFEPDGTVASSLEIAYQGSMRLEDTVLEDPSKLDEEMAGLARWVASALVRLTDLELPFLPPEQDTEKA